MFKFRLPLVVLSLLSLALLGFGGITPPANAQTPTGYINTGRLNLRAGPSPSYVVVAHADQGQDVFLLGRNFDGSWLQVGLPEDVSGWANAYYIVASVSTRSLPVTDGSTMTPKGYAISIVNVRAGPGTSFPVVSRLLRRYDVILLGRNSNGTWVKVQQPDSLEGWVNARYLKTSVAVSTLSVASVGGQSTPTVTPKPPSVIANWHGEYYTNPSLSGAPALVRDDASVNFTWAGSAPAAGLPSDNFSARWTRSMSFPAGQYRFRALVDDGVRVYVDGNLLINDWRDGGQREVGAVQALSGGEHTLRVEYYERTGEALIQFSWENVTAYLNWRGEYWTNATLNGAPKVVRNDVVLDFNWGLGAPDSLIPADNFSARWTRTFDFEAAAYRFRLLVDDGARLWVDDQLVIDEWRGGSAREVSADVALARGPHSLRVEYYEAILDARLRFTWEKVNTPTYPQWKGEYWPNRQFGGAPALTRTDTTIDFNWGGGAPAAGLPADNFAVRWTRDLTFDSGLYRFYAQADDGVRVYVDGVLVMDKWFDNSGESLYQADTPVTSGAHRVVVEYYENQYSAKIKIWWARLGDIPAATPSLTATVTSTASPTTTFTPTAAPTATATPTASPTATFTSSITGTPTASPTATSMPTETVTATAGP